jgi:drug/metabolite transporter (DMT)-like permease
MLLTNLGYVKVDASILYNFWPLLLVFVGLRAWLGKEKVGLANVIIAILILLSVCVSISWDNHSTWDWSKNILHQENVLDL